MEKQNANTNELVMTRNTFEKIKCYSKLICEKENLECYGFLLNLLEKNDLVAYNAILASGQVVGGASARLDPIGALETKAEIENMKCSAIGCWHSHNDMGAWHSGIDNINLEKLIASIACNREVSSTRKKPSGIFPEKNSILIRREDDEIEIRSANEIKFSSRSGSYNADCSYGYTKDGKIFVNYNGRVIFIDESENHAIEYRKIEREKLFSVGFAYSSVFSGDNHYEELAIKETCNICMNSSVTKKQVKAKIIDVDSYIEFN